ncbi:MAG: MFS transporter, partial [Pseudomonadota bacterium]
LLMDRFGPRKLMTTALFVCAAASVAMASSHALLAASVSRLVIGATVAFAFVGTLTILTRWFAPDRFSVYAGILQSSGMVGAMLGQAPLRLAVESVGWRGAVYLMGAIALLLAVAVFVVVPRSKNTATTAVAESRSSAVKDVFRGKKNWLCVLVGFGLAAPMLGFAALWAVPWLSAVRGFSQTQAAGIASMVFMGWLVMAPVVGWTSDWLGKRTLVLLTGSVISLGGFLLILFVPVKSAWLSGMLFFLQGAGGCVMVICFTLMRQYNPGGNTSASLGLLNTFVVGSGALMQPLIGVVLDSRWSGVEVNGARMYDAGSYHLAFLLLVAANAVAVVACCFLKDSD